METGTFIGDGTKKVSIPVSKKCQKIIIWSEDAVESTEAYKNVALLAIDGFGMAEIYKNYSGTSFNGGFKKESAFVTDNDAMGCYAIFNENSIEISTKTAGVSTQVFEEGVTFNWEAW